jgi:hypothetical protein
MSWYIQEPEGQTRWEGDWPAVQTFTGGEDAPTNIEMFEYSERARQIDLDNAAIQQFIDTFDDFLQELSEWQPPQSAK